jgi:5-formyltetrahydrofolate cyclo-ligase
MNKSEIREKIKALRAAMDPENVKNFSEDIKERLLSLGRVMKADCIMAFYSYKNEPLMLEFIDECIGMGKRIVLPRVTGEGAMTAAAYSRDSELKKNIYGIPEPVVAGDTAFKPDIIIAPGIAFDLYMNRLGFGGGYYDRFLEKTDAYKIGVCFDYQIIEKIDAGSHDVPMDIIVTEKRIIGEV